MRKFRIGDTESGDPSERTRGDEPFSNPPLSQQNLGSAGDSTTVLQDLEPASLVRLGDRAISRFEDRTVTLNSKNEG